MKTSRIFAVLMAVCMMMTLCTGAFASGEAGGSGGGTSAPSVDYQSWEVLSDNAGIVIENGAVTVAGDADRYEEGTITATEISGTYMAYDNIGPWNKTETLADGGVAGQSGIVINNQASSEAADDVIYIGGDGENYDVDSQYSAVAGRKFDTVVILGADDRNEENPLGAESGGTFDMIEDLDNSNCTFPGVGLYVAANKVYVTNTLIETTGTHRPVLYTASDDDANKAVDQQATVVVTDSVLMGWGSEGNGSSAPTFTGMYGSTRPTLLNSDNDLYFYNSAVYSSDWGAYSLDQAGGTHVYIVNTYSINTVGGYGVYALGADNSVWMYGAKSVSAQYGIILCAQGSIYMDNVAAAEETQSITVAAGASATPTTFDADAMAEYDGSIDSADYLTEDGNCFIAGSVNAVSFTADGSGQYLDSHLIANGTYFSTLDQDVADEDGNELTDVMDFNALSYLVDYSPITNGAPYFFFNHIDGSTLCYRSINNESVLTGCTLASKTGVVIQSVLGYDSSAGGIDVADGTEYVGVNITLNDMDIQGDILHEDYQRQMNITMNNTTLEGDIVTGTMEEWNTNIEAEIEAAWGSVDPNVDAELTVGEVAEAAGIDMANTIATLEKNDTYESFWGARLTMDENSVWTVAGISSLAQLTVADPDSIQAPAGCELAIYVDVPMDNTMLGYDYTAGTQIEALEAGVTYENVVIVVEGAASDEASAEASEEAAGGSWEAYIAYLTDLINSDTTTDIYSQLIAEVAEAQEADYTGMDDNGMYGAIANLYGAMSYEDFIG